LLFQKKVKPILSKKKFTKQKKQLYFGLAAAFDQNCLLPF
jgi:hypothetical protein